MHLTIAPSTTPCRSGTGNVGNAKLTPMATQGVNLLLSGIGTEAVWQKWMEKYGYTFAEIQKFIPGPAYTAWWLMGNLEGEGARCQEYINGWVELQKKIIARAKELGMSVVLQGFAGFVPLLPSVQKVPV